MPHKINLRYDWRCRCKRLIWVAIYILLSHTTQTFASTGDTLLFRGQASFLININLKKNSPLMLGARYLPQANYRVNLDSSRFIDFEASANLSGNILFNSCDTIDAEGSLKPYRAWARFSDERFEVRLGLQKINFGSASMLRPLMWFDSMDPRDPLQITSGVWALLGRYYFRNNANIWLWGLYGNKDLKTWEVGKTSQRLPELGGRIQLPVARGEAAFTYHLRKADVSGLGTTPPAFSITPEHRFAVDGKWDVGIGLWFEGVWIHKVKPTGLFTNQEMINLGMDYTVKIGNGVNLIFEHLLASTDEKAFAFEKINSISGMSLSYPIGINCQLSTILYRDWKNHNQYYFINLRKQIQNLSVYIMAFANPETFLIPNQSESVQFFSGKGIQIMLVVNY